MPQTSILPAVPVVQAREAWWPRPEWQPGLFGAPNLRGLSAQIGVNPTNFMRTAGTVIGVVGSGIYSALVGDAAAGIHFMATTEEYGSFSGALRATDVPVVGLVNNDIVRVWRLTWWMAVSGAGIATAGDNTACSFAIAAAGAPGQVTGGNPGWGMFMNAAGTWRYRNFQTGAYPASLGESVEFPVGVITNPTNWNYFDTQLIGAAPGRDASWSLLVNGTEIVTRNWVSADGAELADYADGPGFLGSSVTGFQAHVNNTNDPDVGISIANVHVSYGRYTRAGIELLS